MLQFSDKNRSVVFTFGRMNPPTSGHTRLITKVVDVARSQEADHIIFLSQTHNNTTDPLDWDFKTRICQAAFPGVKLSTDLSIKTPFQALDTLAKHYSNVSFVVGGDRVDLFTTRMTPYAKKFGIDNFQVISAGDRDPDSTGISGVSASKARMYVTEGCKKEFMQLLPTRLTASMKTSIYSHIKQNLKIC